MARRSTSRIHTSRRNEELTYLVDASKQTLDGLAKVLSELQALRRAHNGIHGKLKIAHEVQTDGGESDCHASIAANHSSNAQGIRYCASTGQAMQTLGRYSALWVAENGCEEESFTLQFPELARSDVHDNVGSAERKICDIDLLSPKGMSDGETGNADSITGAYILERLAIASRCSTETLILPDGFHAADEMQDVVAAQQEATLLNSMEDFEQFDRSVSVHKSCSEIDYNVPDDAVWPACIGLKREILDRMNNVPITTFDSIGSLGLQGNDRSSSSSGLMKAVNAIIASAHPSRPNEDVSSSNRNRFVMNPSDPRRLWIDLCGVSLLIYEMFSIPYIIAFDVTLRGWLLTVNWITFSFWLLDIVCNFCTGYFLNGELVLQHSMVARRYLQTWFGCDVLALCCDALGIVAAYIFSSGEDTGNSAKMAKLVRLVKVGRAVRLVSLLRMAKVADIFGRLSDYSGQISSNVDLALQVLRLVVLTICVNHSMACIWFTIGKSDSTDTGLHWLDAQVLGSGTSSYKSSASFYQYLTCFHWSLTQMTPGSMRVDSVNSSERVFNIIALLVGMIYFSQTVSWISSQMVQVRLESQEKRQQMHRLKEFFRESHISPQLGVTLCRQVLNRMAHKQPLALKDVPELALLSPSLKTELQKELCGKHVLLYPLIATCASADVHWLKIFIMRAVEHASLAPGDTLFLPETNAYAMFLLTRGTIKYYLEQSLCQDTDRAGEQPIDVDEGHWISEPALFVEWIHVGSAEAPTGCSLVRINVQNAISLMLKHGQLGHLVVDYCKRFWQCVSAAQPPERRWPTDLEVPHGSFHEIAATLPKASRLSLGALALQVLHTREVRISAVGKWTTPLEKEVDSGESTLLVNVAGIVERVVALSVLQLEQDDGRVLTELARWENSNSLVPVCKMPATKQRDSELPSGAVQRLMGSDLRGLAHKIRMQGADLVVQTSESQRYGVLTTYLRSIFNATFTGLDSPDDSSSNHCANDVPIFEVLGQRKPSEGKRGWEEAAESSVPRDGKRRHSISSQGSKERKREFPEAFVFRGRRNRSIYTWLTPAELTHYSADVGRANLKTWLGLLELPEDLSNHLSSGSSTPKSRLSVRRFFQTVSDQ